jgi:hypothetical protein
VDAARRGSATVSVPGSLNGVQKCSYRPNRAAVRRADEPMPVLAAQLS